MNISKMKEAWSDMLTQIASEHNFTVLKCDPKKGEMRIVANGRPFNVSITVPKGQRRNGSFIPYDGYMAEGDYQIEQEFKVVNTYPIEKEMKKFTDAIVEERYMFTDCLQVAINEFSFPVLDENREEIFVNVKFSIEKRK